MPALPQDSTGLARAAARLRSGLTVLVVFLASVVVAERLGYAGVYRHDATSALRPALALQFVFATPALLYLAALWQLRRVAAVVARGTAFGAAVVGALRGVGYCLVGGSALALIAMPLVRRASGIGDPRLIDFDIATLIIGGIGVGLVFLARLVHRAGVVQSELDEIF